MYRTVDEEATYDVRVRGRLDERWSDWLNGVSIASEETPDGRGITSITGHLDQAGLRGLLNMLWDLNLTVVSVASLVPHPRPPVHQNRQGDHGTDVDVTNEPESCIRMPHRVRSVLGGPALP